MCGLRLAVQLSRGAPALVRAEGMDGATSAASCLLLRAPSRPVSSLRSAEDRLLRAALYMLCHVRPCDSKVEGADVELGRYPGPGSNMKVCVYLS